MRATFVARTILRICEHMCTAHMHYSYATVLRWKCTPHFVQMCVSQCSRTRLPVRHQFISKREENSTDRKSAPLQLQPVKSLIDAFIVHHIRVLSHGIKEVLKLLITSQLNIQSLFHPQPCPRIRIMVHLYIPHKKGKTL